MRDSGRGTQADGATAGEQAAQSSSKVAQSDALDRQKRSSAERRPSGLKYLKLPAAEN